MACLGVISRAVILSGLCCLVLASASLASEPREAPTKTIDGRLYGPTTSLRGIYFTNFENSVFTECANETACKSWNLKSGATVNCETIACDDLEKRTVLLNGDHNKSGIFTIEFVGRRAVTKAATHFLNDREDAVLVEKITSFRLAPAARSPNRSDHH